MKKTIIIGMVLGLIIGGVCFYKGYRYGEREGELLIQQINKKQMEYQVTGGSALQIKGDNIE